ncbi:hypothetical protein HMPREF2998_00530 [Corynebacterium sp. HMSC065A05]|uniref:HK97 gp10 family phage protein n=1 Tax=Corynebacterium sp. HMSC065A05 TaxID=1739502 RepID=UPI0008A579B2|nr:hypothetical protein [Corynebacterium sp. HMSC065A05]OFP16004.1 hypothetical protein HMPREF2998_00530 [Corynebacterium sp. HMSC065A05]
MSLKFNSDKIKQQIMARTQKGITSAAQVIEAAAIPLTPVDRGDLRQAAEVIPAQVDGKKAQGGVRYDGLPYIRRQHEELGYNHPRGGQAKYLETARNENAERAAQIIRNHIKGAN